MEKGKFRPPQLRNRVADVDEIRILELSPEYHPPSKITLRSDVVRAGRSGLAMAWLTAGWEAAASYVYHESHCDVQPWARAAHPSCTLYFDSAFHPPWDGKMSISFRAE